MKKKLLFVTLLFAALMVGSCSKSDDGSNPKNPNPDPVNPVNPDPEENAVPFEEGFDNLTDAELDGYTSDLAVRLMFLAMDPDAAYNDIDLIDHYLNGLAYAYSKDTRGIWGQAKAAIDFGLVLKDANALHRSTLVGAMAKWGYSDKNSRDQIWSDIQKSKCLPEKYNSMSSDEFWKDFSSGKLDWYAKEIYKAVMDEAQDGFSKTGDLAAELAVNKLRHIDLTLAVAPKLIEAGANIVFAFGDDLISNGKLAYDFVETNGKVMLQLVDGNLTGEACLDAVNNNLKLLTKGLEEIVPTSQDLTELLSDLTFEQIKALNAEIEDVIKRAGNQSVSEESVKMFVKNVKGIIEAVPWTMNFADQEYVAEDGTFFEIETVDGKAYNFVYCDKNENVLLEAKCAVKADYITIRVDYLDERCDLLPKGAEVGDVIPIPYLGGTSEQAPSSIYLWWNSNQHTFKSFSKRKEVLFTDLKLMLSMYFLEEETKSGRYYTKLAFTQKEMEITKKKNTYTLKAEKEIDNVSITMTMEFDDEGVDDYGRPKMSNIKTLTYFLIPTVELAPKDNSPLYRPYELVSMTIKNIPFTIYAKSSSNNDEYVYWSDYDQKFTMEDFSIYIRNFKKDQEPFTTSCKFNPKYGGAIEITGFYTVEDVNRYM